MTNLKSIDVLDLTDSFFQSKRLSIAANEFSEISQNTLNKIGV